MTEPWAKGGSQLQQLEVIYSMTIELTEHRRPSPSVTGSAYLGKLGRYDKWKKKIGVGFTYFAPV